VAQHIIVGTTAPTSAPPGLGHHYVDTTSGTVYMSAGTSSSADWKPSTTVTNEQIQDVVGPMFSASGALSVVYDDANNLVVFTLNQAQIDHINLLNKGINTHVQIDSHIASNSNPHNVTISQLGYGNINNTSDINKPISTATQVALNAKYDASNPSGFETPAQLNTRDTNNRTRANHTGTQTSSTISDFVSTVLSTVLTGLSFATATAITATDTILQALGKIQAQINSHFGSGGTAHFNATTSTSGFMSGSDKLKLDGIISDVIFSVSSSLTNTSNVTLTAINELSIPVTSGSTYKFEAYLLFDSNNINTGIGLSMGGTSTGTLRAIAQAPVSNTAGTGNNFGGPINALNGIVTTTGVGATGTQYRAQIEGVFTATTSGLIYPQFRSENNGTQVRINIGSNIVYKEY
jgi:hypothetical protein